MNALSLSFSARSCTSCDHPSVFMKDDFIVTGLVTLTVLALFFSVLA